MHIPLANYTTPKQVKTNLHICLKSSVAYILFEFLLNHDTFRKEKKRNTHVYLEVLYISYFDNLHIV